MSSGKLNICRIESFRKLYANNCADYHIALHYDSTSSNKGAFYIGVPDNQSYKNMYPVSKNWKKHNKLGKNLILGMKNAGVKIHGNGAMAIDLTQTSYTTTRKKEERKRLYIITNLL